MLKLDDTLLNAVRAIALQAGEHLKAFYAKAVEVSIKSDKTPVTEADLFISQFVMEQLQRLTPTIPILSEEQCNIPLAERQKWQSYWLIDPLDGTQQFIDRTDQFSVMIALVQQNRPVLGVIHAPILDKTYFAMDNAGAFLVENGKLQRLGQTAQDCKFSVENDRLRIAVGTTCRQKIADTLSKGYQADFIQYGSSSLKTGLVAEGKADCYVRLGDTGEWDTAVAEILLQEVGGKIFDKQFKPLTYNQRETFINPHFVMVSEANIDWQQIFTFTENQENL